MYDAEKELQQHVDTVYWKNGKCCAGCDHWRILNSISGECLKSKIIPAKERLKMVGIENISTDIGAGHAITLIGYVCGNFKDDFNWSILPLSYLKKIGYKSSGVINLKEKR